MKTIIFALVLASLVVWPLSSLAITFNSREISGIVKITSGLSKESIDHQIRSLKDFFTVEEATDYRRQLEEQEQSGTGFIVTYSGCALTNKHVVYDEAVSSEHQNIHLWATDNINEEPKDLGRARLVYYRNLEDLALVCLEDTQGRFYNRTFVKTADYDDLKLDLGEQVYTLGYPENGAEYLTLTAGFVSGKWDEETLKTTMPITAGASGSPVFNAHHQVVGIAQANTGPFDQLGLFLKPSFVLDWFAGYQQVYRETLPELSEGCTDSSLRGVYQKEGAEYYDLACGKKRNYGLESKIAFEYKSYCGEDLRLEDAVSAASYIADNKSTVNHWIAYLESACLVSEPESVFRAGK